MTVPQLTGVRVRARKGGSSWQVTASRLQDLARLVPVAIGTARIASLELDVERWWPPQEGWIGRPGLRGITRLEIHAGDGRARLVIALSEPADAGVVLSAALRCLRPSPTGDLGPELTFTPGLDEHAAPLAARVRDVLLPDEERDAHVRRADVLVVAHPDRYPDVARAQTLAVNVPAWQRDGQPFDVDVDPAVHRPLGRRSVGGAVARATVTADLVAVSGPGISHAIAGSLQPADVRALREVRALVCDELPTRRVARQLVACGVLLSTTGEDLPPEGDDLAWQAASVHQRRHALRAFGPTAAMDAWPSVTVVLVTHRPDHLDHAMAQVARLRYPRLEVVVGAHGPAVDGARVWELAQDVPHPVTVVPLDGDLTLGAALQACCDRADGTLVTKMDDDDVYGPEHVWDLVLAREYSGAQVVGKALDWIHLESEDATVFRPVYAAEKYADFVAGGTMLMSRADLLSVGGWRPVPKSVDRALLDRVIADGGLVYRTHGLGYVYTRRMSGHTASVSDAHFLTRTSGRYEGLVRHDAFGTGGSA